MRTIGLTGGIGSGKSAVAEILADLGAQVIHADAVGHDVYLPGTAGWSALVAAFGADIVANDGTIDRKKLGAIVFSDPAQLKRLNGIVHPLISQEIQCRISRLRDRRLDEPVVVEAAILIEAGWVPLVDEVWLVAAPPDAVVERLTTQRGLSADEVRRRVDSQIADDERRRHAQVVIENYGTADQLRAQVESAWRALASRTP